MHSTLLGRIQLQHKEEKVPPCLVPIVFGILKTRQENQPVATIKILLDSGASSTLIRENWAKNLSTIQSIPTNWTTTAGTFKTTEQVQAQLILPELHEGKTICCNAHVANTLGIYDLIIGRDLLSELGFMLNFKTQTVEWDEIEIPMKPENSTPERSFHIKDSDAIDSATERIKGILEAKYEAADLTKLVSACDHLLVPQQQH
jgi:Retroviral aspartyl protease